MSTLPLFTLDWRHKDCVNFCHYYKVTPLWSTPLFHFASKRTRDFFPTLSAQVCTATAFSSWLNTNFIYGLSSQLPVGGSGPLVYISLTHRLPLAWQNNSRVYNTTTTQCADSQFIYIYSLGVLLLLLLPGHFLFFSCALWRAAERDTQQYFIFAAAPGATGCDLLFVYLLAMERKV